MSRLDPPHAGLLRSVYFVCIAIVSLFAVVTGVFGFYHDPDADEPGIDFSSGIFSGGSYFDDVTIEASVDHLLEQVSVNNVYSVQVIGETIRYELNSGFSIYEAQMPEGKTLEELFDDAGVDTFAIQYIDDSLEGAAYSSLTGGDGDYERNTMIILGAIAAALFAAAALGLGRRFNPLRAGLLGGGLIVFLVAMAQWDDASNDWLGFVVSIITFFVLAGAYPFLDDGLPLQRVAPPPPPPGLTFTPGPRPPEPPSFNPPPPPST
jgi:hypothetical protein